MFEFKYWPLVFGAGVITSLVQDEMKEVVISKTKEKLTNRNFLIYLIIFSKISNENTKATYAVLSGLEQLAAAQGKPITIDATGVRSTINRLDGVSYAKAG